jgi:hypothetical protein
MEPKKGANATETETSAGTAPAAPASNKYTPTAEQIAEWKSKHGDVFAFETEDGKYACYLKRPGRQVVEMASMNTGFKSSDVILDNCWLGGDEELRRVDRYYIGLQRQLGEIIDIAAGTLKKL